MTDLLSLTELGKAKYIEARVPTASEVDAQVDDLFVNSATGVHYICIDDTPADQSWQGTDGNTIPHPILATDHPNLVAMYTMDNISGSTLNDESPNTNNGTITGAVQVAGVIGQALDFDGVDDQVNFGDFYSTAAGTISVWDLTGVDRTGIIYSRSNTGIVSEYFYVARIAGGFYRIESSLSGNVATVQTDNSFDFTQDHHISFVSTGSEYKIYVDGVDEAFTVTGAGGANDGDWTDGFVTGYVDRIGVNYPSGGPYHSNVTYDQLRMFNIAINQAEATALAGET